MKEAATRGEWQEQIRRRLFNRGRFVRIDLLGSGRTVEGALCDIDDRGRLVLRLKDGRLETLAHGELMTTP